MITDTIVLQGHIIDSLLLPKVLDQILNEGGEFEIEEVHIGRQRADPSYARILVRAPDEHAMEALLARLAVHGAFPTGRAELTLADADQDGVFPEGFHVTTNLETSVRYRGKWLPVEGIEMDCGIVVDPALGVARCTPMHRVRQGDKVVVGHSGVRVTPLERQGRGRLFEFMGSDISPEKPKWAMVQALAQELIRARAAARKSALVAGPAVVHTGGSEAVAELIQSGYVSLLFAGNGLAAHDIEYALYGTSLGVRLSDNAHVPGGHTNHLRAINTIRKVGSITAAVKAGILNRGIMYACVTNSIPFVLAGSIRDDGPLPEVITDVVAAVDTLRREVRGVDLVLVLGSTLHAVAIGNILPASARLVMVDINPAALTKLSDRGSFQSVGIVSDVGLFLRQLAQALPLER